MTMLFLPDKKKARMANYGIFSVSKFAKFSRTTRDTLHYYDKLGLLSPIIRGENNNYRYYSSDQLTVANVIRTLQESGMSLAEIKKLRDNRSPESIAEMLGNQLGWIDGKIGELIQTRRLLSTLQKTIHSASNIDERAIAIQYLPEEAIILGEPNDYSGGRDEYDALLDFYQNMESRYLDVDLNYSVWGFFPEERLKRGDWNMPERYYFHNPKGRDKRPAAHYAIGYTRAGYGRGDALYRRLVEYIDVSGFEICGGAYEEYPLNEICVSDDENYLMRVLIAVRER
jgi:DNA-binding transcriptional MerR regulator